MIAFTVMYPDEPGRRFDMEYYREKHLALVKEKVGGALKGVSLETGLSGPAPGSPAAYRVVARLLFDRIEDIGTYMAPHVPAFDADVPNFTDLTPQFQINEVVM
jgi:uncharacterized protein (TIGR02118 family)